MFLKNLLTEGLSIKSFSDYIPSLEDIFIDLDKKDSLGKDE